MLKRINNEMLNILNSSMLHSGHMASLHLVISKMKMFLLHCWSEHEKWESWFILLSVDCQTI